MRSKLWVLYAVCVAGILAAVVFKCFWGSCRTLQDSENKLLSDMCDCAAMEASRAAVT